MSSFEQRHHAPLAIGREFGSAMKADLPCNTKEDKPAKYLACITLLYIICLTCPQYIGLNLILAILCSLIFVARPSWGVFFVIAVHPIMMCYFDIFWTAGLPMEISPAINTPAINTPKSYPVPFFSVFSFQIASSILLPALFFHCRPSLHLNLNKKYQKIIYITLSIFFLWSTASCFMARYPYIAFLGLSRFVSLTIIITYMIRFVQTVETLKKVMISYCCAAVVFSLFAYYGTYHGFDNVSIIWKNYSMMVFQHQGLSNGTQGFISERMGMIAGFGLSAKHELSTFLASGFFYSVYLLFFSKKKYYSAYYLITGFVILITLSYSPSKLTLAGIFISTLLVTILFLSLRRHISLVVILLVGCIVPAFIISGFTRPPHIKRTASTSRNLQVVSDDSQFSPSLKGRIVKMREAAGFIASSHGIGIGPGMLRLDPIFSHVHAHNFFITLCSEHGFPALLCVLIIGGILTCRVFPFITSRNKITFIVVPFAASLCAVLFEYSLDCQIWTPQLWITGTLLWISTHIANNQLAKNGRTLEATENV